MGFLKDLKLRSRPRIVAFATIWTVLSVLGCGTQKAPVSVDRSNMNESSGASSQLEIQVRNPLQLKRTVLIDSVGTPERYAVAGGLLEPGQAVSQMLAGRTICYTKLSNYEPYTGDQIRMTYTRTTKQENGNTVQYLNANRMNETGTASISFVCMKLHNEVQPQELRTAFGDLLKVVY